MPVVLPEIESLATLSYNCHLTLSPSVSDVQPVDTIQSAIKKTFKIYFRFGFCSMRRPINQML